MRASCEKRKEKTTVAHRKRQKMEDTLNRTLLINVYLNHPQAALEAAWVKPQSIKDKLKLYTNIWGGKDANEHEDKKLQKAAIWGERKFMRTAVSPANIIDEALVATEEVVKVMLIGKVYQHTLFRSRKDLRQTTTIREQNFSDHIESFLCHFPLMLNTHLYKPTTILDNDKRVLWPPHFEKKRPNNSGRLPGYTRLCETKADGSVHAVSIDPGIRTPFAWYSPIKSVGKINILLDHPPQNIKIKWPNDSIRRFFGCGKKTYIGKILYRKFDAIVIPPFEVSDIVNRKSRKIIRKTVLKCFVGDIIAFDNA
ncbi:hypothetical protein G9A89_020120 [Geosiphon pyriformis]|nr:hypothetical protein G9A89_020120 [Geosiphon pyriformis]